MSESLVLVQEFDQLAAAFAEEVESVLRLTIADIKQSLDDVGQWELVEFEEGRDALRGMFYDVLIDVLGLAEKEVPGSFANNF